MNRRFRRILGTRNNPQPYLDKRILFNRMPPYEKFLGRFDNIFNKRNLIRVHSRTDSGKYKKIIYKQFSSVFYTKYENKVTRYLDYVR